MQKKSVIKNVFNTLSAILIICAIFLPWFKVRQASLNSVYSQSASHVATHSMSYSYMIGDYLQRFEITTSYTSTFTYDPELVRCDPEHIFYFKKFCDNLNNGAILRPYRYYLAHNMTGACQLEYYLVEKETDFAKINSKENVNKKNKNMQSSLFSNDRENFTFRLFYVYPFNKSYDIIRVYNDSTDFRNWNYTTDGQFVQFIDPNISSTYFKPDIVLKEPYWTTGVAAFGSQNESRVFTIVYPILSDYNETETSNLQLNSSVQKDTNMKSKVEYQIYNNTNKGFDSRLKEEKKNIIDFFDISHKIRKKHKNNPYLFARNIDEAKEMAKQNNISLNNKNRTKKVNDNENKKKIVVTSVASSFFTESLYVILKQRTQAKHSRFIVTDYTYRVLIDNEIGAIYPKTFNDKNMSIFPNISDMNSSLWRSVEKEIIEVPIDIPLLVNASSSEQYMIMKRIIDTRSRYSFYLIMLLELNPTITEIYSSLTNVFIGCFILIFLVLFLLRSFLIFTNVRRKKKLKNKKERIILNTSNIESNNNDTDGKIRYSDNYDTQSIKSKAQNNADLINNNNNDKSKIGFSIDFNGVNQKEINVRSIIVNNYHGTIMDVIEKLRIIQLKNPEDIVLNNMIDSAIEEMTRNEDEMFSIEFSMESSSNTNSQNKSKDKEKNGKAKANSTLSLNCPFCTYLIDKSSDFSILKDNDIKLRKLNEKNKLKQNKILNHVLNIKNNDNDNNFYHNVKDEIGTDLFAIWNFRINSILDQTSDDDLLNTNPHKYLSRMFMKFIQSENLLFNDFYPDSLMLFIISFTKENVFCYHCKIQSFYLLAKLMKNNFKFWIRSKNDIFTLFLALILRNSKIVKTDQIIGLVQSYIGYNNAYFFSILKELIDGTKTNDVMKIYGTLLNRSLSPSFSISNNTKDTVLFMKAILIFSDFAPYLIPSKQNEKCFVEINESIFSSEEKENQRFVSNFHLEIAKNVVAPWLSLLSLLASMNDFQNILLENIGFWLKKSNCD